MSILYFVMAAVTPFVFMWFSMRDYDQAHSHLKLIFYVLTAISFMASGMYAIGIESVEIDIDNGASFQRTQQGSNITTTVTNQHTDTIVFFEQQDGTSEIYLYAYLYMGLAFLFVMLAISETFVILIAAWGAKQE